MDSFLHRVRAAFGDQSLTRLSSRSGGKLFSVTAVLATLTKPLEERGVIAMSSTERFMWPSDHLNYTTLITTNGRTVGVRPLWQTPRVYEIIDFLSPFEVNHLIQIGELAKKDGSMFNSSVGGDHHVWNHAFRYSQQLWINPDFDDEISKRIRERAADVARLPVDLGEETQLLYYPQGGHYIGHLDAIKPKESNAYYDAGGNRIATFLYYLNTVEEGGETVFPRAKQQNFLNQDVCEGKDVESIGLRIKPQKGQVYMFYSLLEESHMQGKIDQTSYHTACPVKGESHKWLANQWIRNKRVNGRLFD
uniref:Fe2OG dioxygenase domain-containing protein n=1 Tax=Paramoeba aestuarina TaxID=180227 RepID=A0A7S4PAD7_9EUKA